MKTFLIHAIVLATQSGSADWAFFNLLKKSTEESLLAATSAVIVYTAFLVHYYRVFERADELIDFLRENKELLEKIEQELRIQRELENSKRRSNNNDERPR